MSGKRVKMLRFSVWGERGKVVNDKKSQKTSKKPKQKTKFSNHSETDFLVVFLTSFRNENDTKFRHF